ncbi:hypothetical protein [Cupriavidus basilensis]
MKYISRLGAPLRAPILAALLAVAMPAMANIAQGGSQARALSMDERSLGLEALSSGTKPAGAGADGARLLVGMSPLDVASATALGKPRAAGGMTDVVLALIDGIGQVPLAGPALITLIAGVADVIGWYQSVADDKPLYQDSLTSPATSGPRV